MTKILATLAALTFTLAACNSGDSDSESQPPDPPAADATPAEFEAFMDDYTTWLDNCGDLDRCAAMIEDDPRYNDFLED